MPSRHAPARPRRPMRRMQRMRASEPPMALAIAAVPSGESSSTNISSQSIPGRAAPIRSTRSGTLSRSFKVGTTIVSSGAARNSAAARIAGHDDHLAAVGFHDFPADDLLAAVIPALDQHHRAHLSDQRERGVLVEDDHQIDGLERGEHFGAGLLVLDRPAVAFEPRRGCIAVEPDYEPIAGGTRLDKDADVAGMQEIEAAVGEPHAQ